jgi:hypothetical protein
MQISCFISAYYSSAIFSMAGGPGVLKGILSGEGFTPYFFLTKMTNGYNITP